MDDDADNQSERNETEYGRSAEMPNIHTRVLVGEIDAHDNDQDVRKNYPEEDGPGFHADFQANVGDGENDDVEDAQNETVVPNFANSVYQEIQSSRSHDD